MNQLGSINLLPCEDWSKVLNHREFKVALLVARGFQIKKLLANWR